MTSYPPDTVSDPIVVRSIPLDPMTDIFHGSVQLYVLVGVWVPGFDSTIISLTLRYTMEFGCRVYHRAIQPRAQSKGKMRGKGRGYVAECNEIWLR